MKLDILKQQWLDIVFEGRNKLYGAYQLRKENPGVTMRALGIAALIFVFLVSLPMLARMLPNKGVEDDTTLDTKIVTVNLPPKKAVPPPPPNMPPPPPPPPKVDQVKFVKPVVAKAEEVVEEPPKIKDLEDKKVGSENIKGDPDAVLTVAPVGTGPKTDVVDDNAIHTTAGVEVKPEFPGGIEKFYRFVASNYRAPEEEGLRGRVYVSFVVEKDGSLTDIKVLRDIGYGTGAEAIRVLKRSPKWAPAEQNGRKVRCTYQLPIMIQSAN